MDKLENLYNGIQDIIKNTNLIVEYKPLGLFDTLGLNVIDLNTSRTLSIICGPNTYSDKDTFEIWDDLFIPNNDVEGHMTQEDIITRIKGEDNV